jgi:hypothetical protein
MISYFTVAPDEHSINQMKTTFIVSPLLAEPMNIQTGGITKVSLQKIDKLCDDFTTSCDETPTAS